MLSIPPHILAIGAFIAWAGLMLSWTRYIYEISEQRRIQAVDQGEIPPDVTGSSNYERAELRENAHRAMQVTPREKWIGRSLLFGVPALIAGVVLTKLPL